MERERERKIVGGRKEKEKRPKIEQRDNCLAVSIHV